MTQGWVTDLYYMMFAYKGRGYLHGVNSIVTLGASECVPVLVVPTAHDSLSMLTAAVVHTWHVMANRTYVCELNILLRLAKPAS